MPHAVNNLFVGACIKINKTGGPADTTTVLDTESGNNIRDQENCNNDADCV